MTAALTTTSRREETTPDKLRAHVGELKRGIQKLEGSLAESRCLHENLTAERGPLVVPARLNKGSDAQKRLHAIDQRLGLLAKDIADDEAAIAELNAQLVCAKNEISLAEWEAERARVRALLVTRLESKASANLQKAARDLAVACEAMDEDDRQLCAELTGFEKGIHCGTYSFQKLRSLVLGWEMKQYVPIDTREFLRRNYGLDLSEAERDCWEPVLEALDRMELVF